jgi:hypothetical protein
MNPDHMAAWREYLAGHIQERCGVAKQVAQKTVTLWLRSLKQDPDSYRIPAPSRIWSQRRGVRTKSAAIQTRSARA